MKSDSIMSLKFAVNVPGVGSFRSVAGRTLESTSGKTKVRILAVFRRGKRMPIQPIDVWIAENSVVSRQYESCVATQEKLRL
jgi:hypothetical protein